jgi:homoserine O-succinyltransferase
MPLVAHSPLPAFERLRQEGMYVVPGDRAIHQDIRELHIGLLNMMPDAALAATERQFLRLVGEANPIAQFYVHPFTLNELPRGPRGLEHVERYYEPFAKLQEDGLDALIITGANVTHPDLSEEPFWGPLHAVVDWALGNVTSVLCSCLATHAVMEFLHGQRRLPLGFKRWGVFAHEVVDRSHPLVNDVNTLFDVPHSRFNDVSRAQFEAAGLHVLAESAVAGVHLAVSADGFRVVFHQGHPEYDTISLLKEYKREVTRFARGERPDYPPVPDNYFGIQARAVLDEHRARVTVALEDGGDIPELPEAFVTRRLHNTWHDTAEAVVGNWIGAVYQVTNNDRRLPFMEEVDPSDPLGWHAARRTRGAV